jgi:hypothetical protein
MAPRAIAADRLILSLLQSSVVVTPSAGDLAAPSHATSTKKVATSSAVMEDFVPLCDAADAIIAARFIASKSESEILISLVMPSA